MKAEKQSKTKKAAGELHGEILLGKPIILRLLWTAFDCTLVVLACSLVFTLAIRLEWLSLTGCYWLPLNLLGAQPQECRSYQLSYLTIALYLLVLFVISLLGTTFVNSSRLKQSVMFSFAIIAITLVHGYAHRVPASSIALLLILSFLAIFYGYRMYFSLARFKSSR